jgi:hypothetical protein
MNRTHPLRPARRLACALAVLAGTLLVTATAAPAAFARPIPPAVGGGTVSPPAVRTIVVGGMPGWQITVIALAAAAAAAAIAVILDRALAARRHHPAPSA